MSQTDYLLIGIMFQLLLIIGLLGGISGRMKK